MSDYKELARVLASRLRTRMSEPVDWKLYTDAADAIEKLSAEVERLSNENNALTAERDQALMLAEGPTTLLDMAAGFAARGLACANWEAEVERLISDMEKAALHVCSWDAGFDDGWLKCDARRKDEIERLKQERAEALAARETYAMTARQDIIEKAKALDDLEAFLRLESVPDVRIEPRAEAEDTPICFAMCIDYRQIDCEGPTIAAAIRAALEKAMGA